MPSVENSRFLKMPMYEKERPKKCSICHRWDITLRLWAGFVLTADSSHHLLQLCTSAQDQEDAPNINSCSFVSPFTSDGVGVWPGTHLASYSNELRPHRSQFNPRSGRNSAATFQFDNLQAIGETDSGASEVGMHFIGGSPSFASSSRHRTKQTEIRDELASVHEEIASLESVRDLPDISDHELVNIQNKLSVKRTEQITLERGLHRLISGQLRQRKFREKMKLKYQGNIWVDDATNCCNGLLT